MTTAKASSDAGDSPATPPAIQQIEDAPKTDTEVAFQMLSKINTDLDYHIRHASPGMEGNLVRGYYERYLEVEQLLGSRLVEVASRDSSK